MAFPPSPKNYFSPASEYGRICFWPRGRQYNSPTENAKDEVEHEERADDNEGDKINPVEETPQSIVSLLFYDYFVSVLFNTDPVENVDPSLHGDALEVNYQD